MKVLKTFLNLSFSASVEHVLTFGLAVGLFGAPASAAAPAAAAVTAAGTTAAQAVVAPPSADDGSVAEMPSQRENIFMIYGRDLISPFVSPVTLSIFAGGTISTLALLATHDQFEDHVLNHASTVKPLGDTSQFGDILGQMLPNVAYVLAYGGSYLFTKDPLAFFRAEMMFRATIAATSMSTVLKTVVREPRPGSSTELTSFPSGHSTSIFAFATVVAAMHGYYWGGATFAVASFVAFSRMNDNRHRLHDVVAGATIGSMYGLSIYQRMRDSVAPSSKTAKAFNYEIMPVATDDGAMIGLSASF